MKRIVKHKILAALPLILFSPGTGVCAQDEREFVEPIAIEETYPNEPGEYDFRVSFQYQEQEDADFYVAPKGQLFFGITERLGGEIAFSYMVRKENGQGSTSGIGNVGFSLKGRLYEGEERGQAVVLGMEVELPTASEGKGLGEGRYEFFPFIALLKNFRIDTELIEHLLLQGNIGYRLERLGEPEDSLVYNFSLAVPYRDGKKWNFFFEVLGRAATRGDDGQNSVSFSPGTKLSVRDELFLAVGLPIELTNDAQQVSLIVQFQHGF